jgi:hypothetical protein
VAGQREEHVVERGLPHLDVIDRDAHLVKGPHDSGRQPDGTGHARPQPQTIPVRDDGARGERRENIRGTSIQPGQADFDARTADSRLEGAGGALGDDAAVVDDRDVVGEFVGFVMLALLRHMSTRVGEVAGVLSFLLSASFEETGISPAMLRERAIAGEPSALSEMLRRAAARGEIGPGEVSHRIAAVPVDLVRHELIMNQAPVPDTDLVEIVDDIFLPLVHRAADAASS